MSNKKKRSWNNLPKEEKQRLMTLADSLYISPMFVSTMYENNQIG